MNKYFGSARMRGVLIILAVAVVLTIGFFGTVAKAAIGDMWALQGANHADVVRVTKDGHLVPGVTGTYDLGSSALRWRNMYYSALVYDTVTSAGAMASTGNFSVGSNTLTVAAATGNTAVNGTLRAVGAMNADGGIDRSTAADLAIGAANATSVTITPATTVTGALSSVGGVKMTEGANKRAGIASLNGSGWITVANTSVGAATRILLTGQNTAGPVYVKSRVNNTSFSIYSTDATDSGAVYWELRDNN